MKLRFSSLEGRIAGLFLLLIMAVQVIGLVVIQQGIDSNARSAIAAELVNGEKVFRKLLEQNAQKRRSSAQILARDTGFVAAVGGGAEGDRATIESALVNSGARARADITMLFDAEQQVVVSTGIDQRAGLEKLAASLFDQAEQQQDGASGTAIVDGRPFQVVVMPVRAPITIAWVVMGFALDRQLVNDMKELSALEAAVFTRSGKAWNPVVSTLRPVSLGQVSLQITNNKPALGQPFDLELDGEKYSARLIDVGKSGDEDAAVILARSIDEATAEYVRLEQRLLLLTVAGIIIAGIMAVLTAKRIAQPLVQLTGTAQRLERGDYAEKIETRRNDEVGALARAFDSMRDGIAKREQEIRRLAYWDTLTNLPNRAQFVLQLDEAIAEARKHDAQVYVLMMDLDRFKHVNDVLGHSFGDALLRQVASRLQVQLSMVAASAQLARLGGDEFAVLYPAANAERAEQLAAELLRSLEVPLSLEDQTVDIGAGLGISGYPDHAADGESLLSLAEVAMYIAKQRNEGAVMYDSSIDKGSATSLSLLTELRNAAERNEFRLFVQPKIALDTGTVVGYESLVRWSHPERGNVFPDQFIPFAEQTGFIRVLTRWVLEQSAILQRQLADQGLHLKCSVNLSTRDLLDQDLPNKFRDVLTRYQLSPAAFCLEITESAIMDDPVRAQHTLDGLHSMGVDLSIDDFGTGYSSLAYLKRLPVDELKIDKSFVLNMEKDIGDAKIVRSTIDLGHNMGLRVVAEGIESEAVWGLLARMGCDQGQGYFMSRPIAADRLIEWIGAWRAPQQLVNTAAPTE